MRNTTNFAPNRRFDVVCLGRFAVDFYAQQIGARLEDVTSFAKYLGGSSANTAFGCARLGLKAALISRVGDDAHRPLPGRDDRARRLRRQPRQHRPVAAHRRGRARHQGQGHVPAHLPARELRRHGDRRGRCRRGVHRAKPRAADHRHAFLDRVHRSHQQPRARPRAPQRRAHGPRHRLPAGALGAHRARRRRDALHRVRHRHRAPAAHPAEVRPRHRHDRGIQHRRRQHRHHGVARRGARGHARRCWWSSAGRSAAR